MAGQLTIDTLKASSGVLATQNGMTGIAKAWVNYNGSTQTVNASFNVSSITYNAAGDYTLNFTTAMPSSNFVGVGSNRALTASGYVGIFTDVDSSGGAYSPRSTTQYRVRFQNVVGGLNDNPISQIAVFGA